MSKSYLAKEPLKVLSSLGIKNYLYLPSTVLIAQVLVGPSKQLKQIIQTEHYIVKNSNWPEANRLALYKRGQRFELGARKWSERDSNLGSLDTKFISVYNFPVE